MRYNVCPYCGHRALPWWRKFFLTGATRVFCGHCGKRVGIATFKTAVVISIYLVAALSSFAITNFTLFLIVAGCLFAAASLMYVFWVPLVPMERP